MRIIYNSIAEDLANAIEASGKGIRKIKYIALSKSEYEELVEDMPGICEGSYIDKRILGTYLGITLVTYKYVAEERMKEVLA